MEGVAPRKNVLVIGETGVGKSSVTNLTLGENRAAVGHGAEPCTFHHTSYPLMADFNLIDTVGFNAAEPGNGQEAVNAMLSLVQLVRSLEEGLSLILFVIRKGRVNATTKKNYDYFVNTFSENQVPVLLVITHCEMDHPIDSWYQTNWQELSESYNMRFNNAVSLTTEDPDRVNADPEMAPITRRKREHGKERLRKAIEDAALRVPWRPSMLGVWLIKIFKAAAVILGATVLVGLIIVLAAKFGATLTLGALFTLLSKVKP